MTKIWSPTNLVWILQRTLYKGLADVPNVDAIQSQFDISPLSMVQAQGATRPETTTSAGTNASSQLKNTTTSAAVFLTPELIQTPITPAPANIPTTGIKIYMTKLVKR